MKNIEEEKKAMILERKLFRASTIGDIEIVDLLLDRGADVNGKDNTDGRLFTMRLNWTCRRCPFTS